MQNTQHISISLNGEPKNILYNLSLLDLLKEYDITKQVVALTLNSQVIKKEEWDKVCLSDGDCIECLTFIGGG